LTHGLITREIFGEIHRHISYFLSKNSYKRVTSKGQVTIPAKIREQAGLLPETEVEFLFDGEVVTIVRSTSSIRMSKGDKLVAHLRGKGDIRLTTDQIMALTRGE